MGACNVLPRIIGAGRPRELLYTGRAMDGAEAERWGFYNRLCEPERTLGSAGSGEVARGGSDASRTR